MLADIFHAKALSANCLASIVVVVVVTGLVCDVCLCGLEHLNFA